MEYHDDEEIISDEEMPDLALKIRKLKEDLKQCRKEKEEYLTGWQRMRADFVNARKEEIKQHEEIVRFAEQKIIIELLDIVSVFDRAFQGLDNKNPYTLGFKHIQSQLMGILRDHGVEAIDSVGKAFDVALHAAVENIPVDSKEKDGIILEEAEKGYMMHGKVIRPSQVKVGVLHLEANK